VQSESQLTKDICKAIPGSDICKNLPPEVSVGLTIVNDKSCVMCDTSQILNALTTTFAMNNLTVTNVDYSSDQGKALLQQFSLTGVPAYIFNASIVNHSSYSGLGQYLRKVGSSYILLVQPVKLVNVVASDNTLELFVMSWCPYGNMAEKALVELLNAMPDVNFIGMHFIATGSGGTFTSMHGNGEVQEDLRQVCIMKYYNNSKFFNYMLCIDTNSSNSENIWQNCASNNSIDVAKIGNCSTGDEGKSLLSDNIALSNSLGIQSSPTFVLDNNTIFNSVAADQLRQVICSNSPKLEGCTKTLSGATPATGGAPSGGCG
jgi:hypothetical protein